MRGQEHIARYKPAEDVAVYAVGANINAGHFVTVSGKNAKGAYKGAHTTAGGRAFGVAERDAIADVTDHRGGTNCNRLGAIAFVVAGAAIAQGADVMSDATGRAITYVASGSNVRLGTNLVAVTAAGQIAEIDRS